METFCRRDGRSSGYGARWLLGADAARRSTIFSRRVAVAREASQKKSGCSEKLLPDWFSPAVGSEGRPELDFSPADLL